MGNTIDNDLAAVGGLDDVAGLICLQCFDGSIRQLIRWLWAQRANLDGRLPERPRLNCRSEPRKGADLLPERPRL